MNNKAAILVISFFSLLLTFFGSEWGTSFCLAFDDRSATARFASNLYSQYDKRRIVVGLALFPNIISIDLDINEKRTNSGSVLVLIVYEYDQKMADSHRDKLMREVKTIRKHPVEIITISVQEVAENYNLPVGGIYLAENMSLVSVRKLLKFAIKKQCILFSPYENAVNNGVTIGISITSKIQPIVNLKSLRQSAVRLHKLFLRSAEKIDN